jgi:hypothetical protein
MFQCSLRNNWRYQKSYQKRFIEEGYNGQERKGKQNTTQKTIDFTTFETIYMVAQVKALPTLECKGQCDFYRKTIAVIVNSGIFHLGIVKVCCMEGSH